MLRQTVDIKSSKHGYRFLPPDVTDVIYFSVYPRINYFADFDLPSFCYWFGDTEICIIKVDETPTERIFNFSLRKDIYKRNILVLFFWACKSWERRSVLGRINDDTEYNDHYQHGKRYLTRNLLTSMYTITNLKLVAFYTIFPIFMNLIINLEKLYKF